MRPDEHHPAYRAGRLVQWGLRLRARPVQTPEYQALIDAYFDDPAFRDAVHAVAAGLGLVVLDVSEHGVVLSPSDESVFALKPSQFRPTSSGADQRLVDGLVQIAIAATVFPRARDLEDDPDHVPPPVTDDEVAQTLSRMCDAMEAESKREPDPEAGDVDAGLEEAWRIYRKLPQVKENRDGRRSSYSVLGYIDFGLERLRQFGCFVKLGEGDRATWQATRRYRLLVVELAQSPLFGQVHDALARVEAEVG